MFSDRSFTARTILLTGASAGIGREIALQLAPERPHLILAARDPVRLEEVAARCRELGATATAMPTDVSDQAACCSLVARAVELHGGLDVLLLNAGQDMATRLDALTDRSLLERLMRINYLGSAWLAAEALPQIVLRRGRIVVVSSLAGLTGVPTRTGYAASKHALHGFFDSLRCELHGSGVTVSIVCPDFVASEIHRRAWGADGRPVGLSPVEEARIMGAAVCARAIVEAARRRRRLVLLSRRGKVGRYVRLLAPGLIDWIARRSVARGF